MKAILSLLVILGWVLGIVGFFRARRAERSLAALRSQVERLLATSQSAATPWQAGGGCPLTCIGLRFGGTGARLRPIAG
jgi:hypothetical protein